MQRKGLRYKRKNSWFQQVQHFLFFFLLSYFYFSFSYSHFSYFFCCASVCRYFVNKYKFECNIKKIHSLWSSMCCKEIFLHLVSWWTQLCFFFFSFFSGVSHMFCSYILSLFTHFLVIFLSIGGSFYQSCQIQFLIATYSDYKTSFSIWDGNSSYYFINWLTIMLGYFWFNTIF